MTASRSTPPRSRSGRDAAHAEWFYGFRLAIRTDLGSRIVRAWSIVPAAVNEREVAIDLLHAGQVPRDLLADKGFNGKAFTARLALLGTAVLVPPGKDQRASAPSLLLKVIAQWRNRVETCFAEITDRMELARHGADSPAVVRAYRDEKLTLRECAVRFTTSVQTIRMILQASDIPIRSQGSRRPAGLPGPQDADVQQLGAIEHDMRAQGIHDHAVLSKARELDQAIARARLADAAQTTRRPTRTRTAAQLASKDQPPGYGPSPGTPAPAPDHGKTTARPSSRPARSM
jgi:hypothetical protein